MIAIWMSVTPIPVLFLLAVVQLVVFTKLLLILPRVLTVGAIFVLIPVVVVLVAAMVDTGLVSVVALGVFLAFVFLTSVVLSGRDISTIIRAVAHLSMTGEFQLDQPGRLTFWRVTSLQ